MAKEARKPDFTANALDKDTNVKGRVGAAWKQPDGSIQIVLDPWVVLKGKGHNCNPLVTLFPYQTKEEYEARKAEREARKDRATAETGLDDEIPF